MTDLAASMRGICKSFSGVRVLDSVDFDLERGEVHALVGGNGAGKSTLMKILVGAYSLDEGTYEIDGREVRFQSTHDARDAGVGMVFQEFSLVPQLTVAQNIYLTREPRSSGLINDSEMVQRSREIFASMKVDIDPRRSLEDLPTAFWQLTEIAKALSQDARVLIFDEPTTALAKTETQDLFALIRHLKEEQQISIVYISHRMEEIFEISDRITVLRDGRTAMTRRTTDLSMADVIGAIVGQQLEHSMDYHERDVADEVVLEARHLTVGGRVQDVDLKLRRGEVLGLAGLMGSGRTELARALFGIDRVDSGELLLNGKAAPLGNPNDAIEAGIVLIPEDRRVQGLVLDHSIYDNITLPMLGRLSRAGIVDDGQAARKTDEAIKRLSVVARSARQAVKELSGGNQQKVVIGKWLGMDPQILIMDEPTAGVDIGTKAEIVGMIRAFADAGGSVIMISSELPELLAVSDRLLILRDGHVASEIDRQHIQREEDLHHAVQGIDA